MPYTKLPPVKVKAGTILYLVDRMRWCNHWLARLNAGESLHPLTIEGLARETEAAAKLLEKQLKNNI